MAHFARGARGALITPLRLNLGLQPSEVPKDPAPMLHDPAFDEFDGELELKVKALQEAAGSQVTGVVDRMLYKSITGNEWPDLYHRALMVIGIIEHHGYFKFLNPDAGKADPAGLTAGIIGFTATYKSLNKVLALIPDDVINAAFAAHGITTPEQQRFRTFVSPAVFNGANKNSRQLAIDLFLQKDEKTKKLVIHSKWLGFLRDVLRSEAGINAQHLIGRTNFDQGIAAAEKNGITSEIGKVLTFSMNVQAFLSAKLVSTGADRERRVTVALKRAGSITGTMANFEARHLQLARGVGFPNGQFIDLTAWGFDDPDQPPADRSRILSIGVSGRDSMAALARFERAAIDHKLIEDSVTTSTAFTTRLAAAKVPFANDGEADLRTPNLSRAWDSKLADTTRAATRRAYVEVLLAVDELPLDCLLLGGDALGTGVSEKNWLWARAPLALNARAAGKSGGRAMSLLAWRGEAIDLPLNLTMPAGLVVLYTTRGIGAGASFGLNVFDAIVSLNDTPPIVLGWHGAISLPGRPGPTPEQAFLQALADAKAALNLDSLLRDLVRKEPERVIQAWGRACFETYGKQPSSFLPLWRKTKKKGSSVTVTSACAAIDPERKVWLAAATPTNDIFMERV